MIEIAQLSVARGPCRVLDSLDLRLSGGELIALIGLNGAGKSTLLETMAGALLGYEGSCRVDGLEVRICPARELAQRVAFLPQTAGRGSSVSGRQVVFMGRYPHSPGWQESPADAEAVSRAMREASCAHLASRSFAALSGGERQRLLLAAALAQESPVMLLDEPAAHVDLPHQIEMYRLLAARAAQGTLCVAATHDLNLAARFANRILLLDRGHAAAFGSPVEVLTSAAFRRAFGAEIQIQPGNGGVQVTYA